MRQRSSVLPVDAAGRGAQAPLRMDKYWNLRDWPLWRELEPQNLAERGLSASGAGPERPMGRFPGCSEDLSLAIWGSVETPTRTPYVRPLEGLGAPICAFDGRAAPMAALILWPQLVAVAPFVSDFENGGLASSHG